MSKSERHIQTTEGFRSYISEDGSVVKLMSRLAKTDIQISVDLDKGEITGDLETKIGILESLGMTGFTEDIDNPDCNQADVLMDINNLLILLAKTERLVAFTKGIIHLQYF